MKPESVASIIDSEVRVNGERRYEKVPQVSSGSKVYGFIKLFSDCGHTLTEVRALETSQGGGNTEPDPIKLNHPRPMLQREQASMELLNF